MHGTPVDCLGKSVISEGQPPATPDISGSVKVRTVSDLSESFALDRFFFMANRVCNRCTTAGRLMRALPDHTSRPYSADLRAAHAIRTAWNIG